MVACKWWCLGTVLILGLLFTVSGSCKVENSCIAVQRIEVNDTLNYDSGQYNVNIVLSLQSKEFNDTHASFNIHRTTILLRLSSVEQMKLKNLF